MSETYIIVSGRRAGKTTKTIEWVERGNRVDQYPFWDRIIVTATIPEANRIRRILEQRAYVQAGQYTPMNLQYTRVYSAEEWQNGHINRAWKGEIAVDNAEWFLTEILRQRPTLITMTGSLLNDRDPRTI